MIRSTPATLKYEPGVIVAEDDYVIVHGRFSGTGRFSSSARQGFPISASRT
jgi:hypothetical protein